QQPARRLRRARHLDPSLNRQSGIVMRLSCFFLALIVACAGSNPSPTSSAAPQTLSVQNAGSVTLSRNDGPNELSVPLTVAQVWAVLPAVYDSLGIQLTTVDGRTHLIRNAGFKARQ